MICLMAFQRAGDSFKRWSYGHQYSPIVFPTIKNAHLVNVPASCLANAPVQAPAVEGSLNVWEQLLASRLEISIILPLHRMCGAILGALLSHDWADKESSSMERPPVSRLMGKVAGDHVGGLKTPFCLFEVPVTISTCSETAYSLLLTTPDVSCSGNIDWRMIALQPLALHVWREQVSQRLWTRNGDDVLQMMQLYSIDPYIAILSEVPVLQMWLASDNCDAAFLGWMSAFCGDCLLASSFFHATRACSHARPLPPETTHLLATEPGHWLPAVTEGLRWLVCVLRDRSPGNTLESQEHLRHLVIQFLAVKVMHFAAHSNI